MHSRASSSRCPRPTSPESKKARSEQRHHRRLPSTDGIQAKLLAQLVGQNPRLGRLPRQSQQNPHIRLDGRYYQQRPSNISESQRIRHQRHQSRRPGPAQQAYSPQNSRSQRQRPRGQHTRIVRQPPESQNLRLLRQQTDRISAHISANRRDSRQLSQKPGIWPRPMPEHANRAETLHSDHHNHYDHDDNYAT